MEPDPARRERFEELFRAGYGAVLAYARRRAPADVAQDVAAQTFAVAWRRLDVVPEPPLPWLYGVARRVLANELRGARRRAALSSRAADAVPAAEPAGPSPLLEALARLAPRDQDALLLTAWEGLSSAEAAAALGCTRAAFRVRLHRARRKLAAELEPDEEPVQRLAPTLEEPR